MLFAAQMLRTMLRAVFVVVFCIKALICLLTLYKQYNTTIAQMQEKSFVRKQALSIFLLSACFYYVYYKRSSALSIALATNTLSARTL